MREAPRILVVGGRGFIGSHIVAALLSHRAEVAIYGPPMEKELLGALANRCAAYQGTAEDEAELAGALADFRPRAAIWAAGRNTGAQGLSRTAEAEVARAIGVNAGGFAALLHACAEAGVPRVLQAGSSVVFGPASLYGSARITEAAPPAPRTGYGLSKLMAEAAAEYGRRRFGLQVSTLRLPLVIGPGRWYAGAAGPLLRIMLAAARAEPAREEVPAEPFDLAYAADVGDVFARLAVMPVSEVPPPPLLHLVGVTVTYRTIAHDLRRLAPDAPVPELIERRSADPLPLMDGGLLRRTLDWEPAWTFAAAAADMLAQVGHGGGTAG